ncbi:DUF4157 domain-containing protein [Oceanibaculum sp.]|uniref:eCIS core domain-containing protein n=1 Tax=Oceanibaculum sp. TaxID=1903597 RepID=UPI0025828C18|nr:DUF4157 domain-containing protein [Oceanibaculum sp.]MCH2394379.1 DUF4157 domain-containing protein [Oceanibaculum sp.]
MRLSVIQGRFRAGALPGSVIQRHGGGEAFQVPAAMAARLGMPTGGQPLPPTIQRHMEGVLGVPLGDVRVRVGPEASALGAVAFTMGSTIHFAPGRYDPGSRQGLQLLGHELAHVVQQRQGRVANPFGSGIAVVSDRALEAQADAIGIKAAMAAGAAPSMQMKRQMQAGPMPLRPGTAGGGQVAQPFLGLGTLAGYASSAVGYVGSAVAAHPYVALMGLGAAALSYYFLKGDTPGMQHNLRIARRGQRRPNNMLQVPPQYSITLNAYKHGRLDVGHAFITIQMDGYITMAMGLSPRDLPTHDLSGTLQYLLDTFRGQPGRIYMEFDSLRDPNLKRRTWNITEDQAIKAMRKMNEDRRLNLDTSLNMQDDFGWGGGPSYNAFSNCASWALDVLAVAGISTWGLRGLIDRPGAFYNAI